jgi:hypothetical protein
MIMKKSVLIKSLLLAASLPLLAGCVINERPPVAVASPTADVVVTQPEAPPPPQADFMPAPPGPLTIWLWVPGCWEWRGHWVWVGGCWAPRPHPHAVWVAGHWGPRGHGYVWVGGHWR